MKITVLGCGASGGVPLVGCTCAVCTSSNPKNKRYRVSLHIETSDTTILIDTSPDLREQCLKNNISRADHILFSHDHADHTHGIDDIRSFNFAKDKALDIYADTKTLESLKNRFAYIFRAVTAEWRWHRPSVIPHTISPNTSFFIGKTEILPLEQVHGKGTSLGFRVGKFAYSTDVNVMPEATLEALEGIDTWIVDCLRYAPAPTHAHLELTLEWITRVKPKRAYLTHMNHTLDYEDLLSHLPNNVYPAYDGLILNL